MIEVKGVSYPTDEEGYLKNIEDWSEAVAEAMALEDDLKLSEAHWDIIRFLREYYDEYEIAPAVRVLTKAVGRRLGKEKGNSKYLYTCLLYTSPSPRDLSTSRMPSSA